MKKDITRFCAFLLIVMMYQRTGAQNTWPYWSMAGNNNATALSKLGTTNTIPLNFYTKNLLRMRLDTAGRLGINTSSPQALLDVNTTSGFQIARFNDNQAKMYLGLYKSGKFLGYIGSYSGSANDVDFGTTTSNTTGKTHITTRAVPRLTIDTSGNVGIGTTAPAYKLQVLGRTVYAIYAFTSGNIGIFGTSNSVGVAGSAANFGLYGYSSGNLGMGAYGNGYYGVYGNGTKYGIYGNSIDYGVYGSGYYGIYGVGQTFGVYGEATSSTGDGGSFFSATGYGIYAQTNYSDGYAGVFSGNVYSSGSYTTSDSRLKKNIVEFADAMSIINHLKPKTYEFITNGNPAASNLPTGKHYGLIAQEVEEILPNLVKEVTIGRSPGNLAEKDKQGSPVVDFPDKSLGIPSGQPEVKGVSISAVQANTKMTIKALNYTELVPILIKGMQEQDKVNKDQQQQINELQAQVSDLKEMMNKLSGNVSSSVSGFSLGQGIPNPAFGSTSISYILPQNSNKGQLVITNSLGQIIKTFELAGSGTKSLDTSMLESGVYTYSLIVEGKILDTKKLIVAK